MLELLLLFGLVAYLVSKSYPRDAERLGAAHAPLGSLQRLTIADTQRPQLTSAAFVRAFGLDPRDVRDICMYARGGPFETFPAALAALFRDRALRDGEAVYFALTAAQPMPRVVAFLDKRP